MSSLNLKLSADKIYNQNFSGAKSGYNCLQVDTLLDSVISDYEVFESYVKDQDVAKVELERINKLLNEKVTSLQVENTVLKQKLDDVKGITSSGQDNLSLLKELMILKQLFIKPESILQRLSRCERSIQATAGSLSIRGKSMLTRPVMVVVFVLA